MLEPFDTYDHIVKIDHYGAPNYAPLPVVLARGKGSWVWDIEGNKYIDCLSGYSSLNQGHVHPRILKKMIEQAENLTLTSRAFLNDQMGPYFESLCSFCEMDMVLPMNTGAEAVETSIKAARKWGYEIKGVSQNQAEILTFNQNFHGRTTTIISFSDEKVSKKNFGPFTPGFKSIPYGNRESIEQHITPNTVALLIEPIQGEAGIIIPPRGYLSYIRKLCDHHNIVLIYDEIQTGLGRTGKKFAYQYEEEAKPDMLLLGKALSGGFYPISAVVGKKSILECMQPGSHGSTFGGNPLACAIAKEALQVIIEEKLPQRAQELGAYLLSEIKALDSPYIETVRGKGLMIGIDIQQANARDICEKLMAIGVLTKETRKKTIRLSPPLVIEKAEIDWVIKRLEVTLCNK